MSRLLLTGANGFVGRLLAEQLQHAGYEVIALSGRSHASAGSAQRVCDIVDAAALNAVVAETRPTHVVHLAAISHVPTSFAEPLRTWQTNVMGSLNLLEAVKAHAPDAFVLFASSSEVYGGAFKSAQPLGEDSPCLPLNPYAASKLAAEAAFREYFRQGMAGVIARPFNHIGAGQSADFVTASFARQIALIECGKQAPVMRVGNLEASRDFLDVRDVCAAYLRLLALDTSSDYPRCLNIASSQPRKIRDILDGMLALTPVKIEVELDPARLRPSDIPLAAGDNRLLTATTGWQPGIELNETLEQLLDHWREQVKNEPAA